MMRAITLLLLVVACGPVTVPMSGESSATGSADSTSGTETSGATSATTVGTSADDPSTTIDPDAGDASDAADENCSFIQCPDVGGGNIECDIWIDDCPSGQKCMPWDNMGGNAWNATRCTPLAHDPKGVGEPCTVEDNAVSGIDDCEARAVCWDVDPETNMGVCVAMCTGSESRPTCDDPCEYCQLTGEGVLILCHPTCDPVLQDCDEGSACYPVDGAEVFRCTPDAGGDMGALGDPCEFINTCDPGLFCAHPDLVPAAFLHDCGGEPGCCTPLCDATAATPCPQPGLETAECIPWFDEGEAPPCLSGVVGACVLPE
jgi:hypothetical protein